MTAFWIKVDDDIKINDDIENVGNIEITGNSDKFSGLTGKARRRNMNIAGATLENKNISDNQPPAPNMNSTGSTGPTDSKRSTNAGRKSNSAHSFASENMKFQMDKEQKFTGANMQPHGARISASLATKFDGYQRNYGLIPQTLDEVNEILENVRTEQQPRIDKVLDNINNNLEESRSTLAKANDTMETIQTALSILDFDTKYIKYGAMAIGGLVVLNLFVGLIVLTRAALGM
jgi:hypothetical protein